MSDTKNAFITIQGVDSKLVPSINATVFTIKTDEGEFTFWKTKRDGSNTVAYDQYQERRYMAGDQVEVLYNEVDASYTHKVSGKKIEKVNKIITKFLEDEVETNTMPPHKANIEPLRAPNPVAPQTSQEILGDIKLKVDLIFEILNDRPAVAKESIPIIHADDDLEDVNAELGDEPNEINPDDLGF